MIRILQSVLPAFLLAGVAGPAIVRVLHPAAMVVIVTGCAAAAALLVRRLDAGEPRLALVLAAALMGSLHTLAAPSCPVPPVDEPLCSASGRIVSRYEGRFGSEVRLDEARVVSILTPSRSHAVGPVRIRVRGTLAADFDRGVVVRARGRLLSTSPDRLDLIASSPAAMTREDDLVTRGAAAIHRLRGRVADRLASSIDSPVAADMAAALLTGRRLEASNSALLRDAGVVHLFVVSGLHLAVLALALSRIPPFAGARTGNRPLALAVAVAGFAVFSGARPPVLRALAAIWLVALARRHGRPVDGGWIVIVVGALHLALHPDLARDPSFLLSMSAVCGIVFLARPWRDRRPEDPLEDFLRRKRPRRIRRALRSALVVSFSATMATAPVSLMVFGSATLASIPGTPLLAPLVALFGLASALAVVSPRYGPIAGDLGGLIEIVCVILQRVPGAGGREVDGLVATLHVGGLILAAVLAGSRKLSIRRRRAASLLVPSLTLSTALLFSSALE